MAVHRGGRHAIGNTGCRDFAFYDVIEQDIAEGRLAFRRVQRCEVNTCVCEGLVRWSKHREGDVSLEG